MIIVVTTKKKAPITDVRANALGLASVGAVSEMVQTPLASFQFREPTAVHHIRCKLKRENLGDPSVCHFCVFGWNHTSKEPTMLGTHSLNPGRCASSAESFSIRCFGPPVHKLQIASSSLPLGLGLSEAILVSQEDHTHEQYREELQVLLALLWHLVKSTALREKILQVCASGVDAERIAKLLVHAIAAMSTASFPPHLSKKLLALVESLSEVIPGLVSRILPQVFHSGRRISDALGDSSSTGPTTVHSSTTFA